MVRRWQAAVLAVLSVAALACEAEGTGDGGGGGGEEPRPPVEGLPGRMAALGDSITAGYGSCLTLVACSRNSWSAGHDLDVDSHYRRIREDNPDIDGNAHNFAKPGARARDLEGQAGAAVKAKAEYVTILIGANDACRDDLDAMTPVADFRSDIDAGLARLKKGLPEARILIASIPDLHRLWEIGHTEDRAVAAWSRGVCPTMLADPRNTSDQADDRRRAVAERVDDYNRELRRACRDYGEHCRHDEGAVHRVRFGDDLVSHLDWFHPSIAGQDAIAEETFPRSFSW